MQNNWLPSLDSLRCFVALVERKNFRAAAEEVGLSPAAFSERIRRLEQDFGAQLFVRTTRKVEVSTAGLRQPLRMLQMSPMIAVATTPRRKMICPFGNSVVTSFTIASFVTNPAAEASIATMPFMLSVKRCLS